MTRPRKPARQQQDEALSPNPNPVSFSDYIFQGVTVCAMTGVFSLAFLASPDIRNFLSFIPTELAWSGVKLGFGIPAAYACARLLLMRGKGGLQEMFGLLKRGRQNKNPHNPTGLTSLLPSPPPSEYERSGQGYARQVAPALVRTGLVRPDQKASVLEVRDGPAAARITVSLPPGLRLSRLENAGRDLQAAIGAPSLQVQAGPQANTAALIITHRKKQPVVLRQLLETPEFQSLIKKNGLPVPVGVNEVGEPVLTDLTRVAHILVAGATGAGKSWWLNQLLVTWLLYLGPDRLRLVLVDPKQVELSQYADFPHVLTVARQAEEAVCVLETLAAEMDSRYSAFADLGVRNIAGYRQKTGENMPYIACVIDELADLMVQAKKKVEPLLQRLAQLGRASGIHLVVATQRPSVDVITGVIKANLPTRVVFRLAKNHDYMTVLDDDPKVALTGRGDGIAAIEGEFGLIRFQSAGVGVSDEQADEAIDNLKKYWAEKSVRPAQVPAFSGGLPLLRRWERGANGLQEEEPELPEDPIERAKTYIAGYALERDGEEVFLPPADALARSLKLRKADVIEILRQLEAEGWVSPVESAGRAARRRVLAGREELSDWL